MARPHMFQTVRKALASGLASVAGSVTGSRTARSAPPSCLHGAPWIIRCAVCNRTHKPVSDQTSGPPICWCGSDRLVLAPIQHPANLASLTHPILIAQSSLLYNQVQHGGSLQERYRRVLVQLNAPSTFDLRVLMGLFGLLVAGILLLLSKMF